jgi:general secretion pathway protein D
MSTNTAALAIPTPGTPAPSFQLPDLSNTATTTAAGTPAAANPNVAGQVPPGANAAAAPRADQEEIIKEGTLAVQGMNTDQFLEIYSAYSGRTVLRPYQLPAAALTLKNQQDLTRREAVEAMDGVLALNGVTMIPLGEKFVKAVPSTQAIQEGAAISEASAKDLPDAEQFVTRIVKLKTAKPSEMAPLFASFSKNPAAITPVDSNNTLILRDFASNVKRMLEIIERVDVAPEVNYKLEVIPIKYGKVGEIYETMNALIGGTGGGGLSAASGAATGAGGGAMNRSSGNRGNMNRGGFGSYGMSGGGGMNRGGYGMGGGMNSGYSGGGYYPQQASAQPVGAAGGQNSFQQRLNQIVSKAAGDKEIKVLENARIVPDERSNKLLIFASKHDMDTITNIVAKVDVLLAQVLIEAIIMEVSLTDEFSLGVSMLQNPRRFGNDFSGGGGVNNGQPFLNNITNFSGGLPSGFSYFGNVAGGNLDVAVTALAKDGIGNVVSRPRIQTSHAIPGNFFIGETVPYVTGVQDYGYYGGVSSGIGARSTIQQASVGFNLSVTPFITPEGLVVMEIAQSFDTRGADVLIDGNPIPIINNRTADATLTLRDGDTIMMGGFITENKSKNKSGVPILKDIPGLGALFRSKTRSSNRKELIVLLRATVLPTPESAALTASNERALLPGIQQAEKEFKEDEKKRRKTKF